MPRLRGNGEPPHLVRQTKHRWRDTWTRTNSTKTEAVEQSSPYIAPLVYSLAI
jgi:hypothetical protein